MNLRKYFFALCLVVIGAISFSSCSKDDDPVKPDQNTVIVNYLFKLGAGWFDLYNVTLVYLEMDGMEREVKITNAAASGYANFVPYNSAPNNYACKVVAKVKPDVSIDELKEYDLSVNMAASVIEKDTKGNKVKTYGSEYAHSKKFTLSGNEAAEYLKTNPEQVLMDYSTTKQ